MISQYLWPDCLLSHEELSQYIRQEKAKKMLVLSNYCETKCKEFCFDERFKSNLGQERVVTTIDKEDGDHSFPVVLRQVHKVKLQRKPAAMSTRQLTQNASKFFEAIAVIL